MPARYLVAVANNTEKTAQLALGGTKAAGFCYQRDNNTLYVLDPDGAGYVAIGVGVNPSLLELEENKLLIGDASDLASPITLAELLTALTGVAGVAADYAIARGEHQQAAASDTIVTGLATVVAVVITPRTRTVKQLWFEASIGDQAGTPAAGSILITSKKPTAVDDCTPTAATDFTDNIKVNWIAIGTL